MVNESLMTLEFALLGIQAMFSVYGHKRYTVIQMVNESLMTLEFALLGGVYIVIINKLNKLDYKETFYPSGIVPLMPI